MTHEREGGRDRGCDFEVEQYRGVARHGFVFEKSSMGHPNGPSSHRLTNLILEYVQFFHHSLVEPSISFLYLSITSSRVSISLCILITSHFAFVFKNFSSL